MKLDLNRGWDAKIFRFLLINDLALASFLSLFGDRDPYSANSRTFVVQNTDSPQMYP